MTVGAKKPELLEVRRFEAAEIVPMQQAHAARLVLVPNSTGIDAAIARASALAERDTEFGQRLLGLLDRGIDLVALETDQRTAVRAGEVIVRLEPSEAFRLILAAHDAGDGQGKPVEGVRHV